MWRFLQELKMADPIIPYPLLITSTNNTAGEIVIENLGKSPSSTNPLYNKLRKDADSNKKAVLDLGNMTSGYSNGNILFIKSDGIRVERGIHTVNTSILNPKVTLTGTASDYAGASISP